MRFPVALLAVSVLCLFAEDKPDPRHAAVEEMGADLAKVGTEGADDTALKGAVIRKADDFAARFVPAAGVLAIASDDGKAVLVAGGARARDGVTVILAQAPKGRRVQVRGGNGGKRGAAGRAGEWSDGRLSVTGGNVPGPRGGRAGRLGSRGQGTFVELCTGEDGEDAVEATDKDICSDQEIGALAAAVDRLDWDWDEEDKCKVALEAVITHRPSHGAIAAYSKNGRLLVLIGANGEKGHPDGISTEVAGKIAERIVSIAGDAAPEGKPGTATAPEGGLAIQGK